MAKAGRMWAGQSCDEDSPTLDKDLLMGDDLFIG